MRVFNTLKWAALPLALSLAGCSLFSGPTTGTPATLLAYISLQSLDQVNVVSLIQRNPANDPIPAGPAPANMALNPRSDREYLYVANHTTNTISFLNVRTRQLEVPVLSGSKPWDVAITPNGQYLFVTNTGDNTVAQIDVEGRQRRHLFTFPSQTYPNFKPRGIATHPVGAETARKLDAYVVSEGNIGTGGANAGQVVVLSDRQTGTAITVNGAVQLWKAAVTADGNRLLVTDRGSSNLWTIDLTTGVAGQPITLPSAGWDVVVSPNKQKPIAYVSLPDTSAVVAVDLTTNTAGQANGVTITGDNTPKQPHALALNSQGTELWVALAGSNQVVVFPNLDGTTQFPFGVRLVNYSYTPGQTGAPEDIVLGRGVQ